MLARERGYWKYSRHRYHSSPNKKQKNLQYETCYWRLSKNRYELSKQPRLQPSSRVDFRKHDLRIVRISRFPTEKYPLEILLEAGYELTSEFRPPKSRYRQLLKKAKKRKEKETILTEEFDERWPEESTRRD